MGLTSAILVSLLLVLGPARSETSEDAVDQVPHGPLDGMRFVGTIGPDGQPGIEDTLYFGDGQFWSQSCVRCGFAPGFYWVRFIEGAIHFQGELESAERGRFTYSGVVRDGQVIAHIKWRHRRWYWSINRDFVFRGDLVETATTASAVSAARQARAADPRRDDCNSGTAS